MRARRHAYIYVALVSRSDPGRTPCVETYPSACDAVVVLKLGS